MSSLHSGGGRSVFGFSMSRKRAKSDSGFLGEEGGLAMDDSPSASQGSPVLKPAMSYAAILRNRGGDVLADMELELSDEDCCYSEGKLGVGLCFSERAHDVLKKPWGSAVVVRLMGKPSSVSSFDFLLRGLRRKWRSNGGWKLIDLLNDWFIVKFELEEDMEEVLCGGPWVIAGQTLVVKRWSASFNPVSDEVGSMAVWARVVGLPVMYFTNFAMRKIGKLLGEVLRVDAVTLGQERGRFARVCVEVDLAKAFKSSVIIDNVCYKVQYEGLSLLCFGCGRYGHSKDKCPDVVSDVEPSSGDICAENSPCDQMNGNSDDNDMGDPMGKVGGAPEGETGIFGPWMLVNYKNKKKAANDNVGTKSGQGSRFASLQEERAEGSSDVDIGVKCSPVAEGKSSNSAGEVGKVWTFLQNKMKEKIGGTDKLEMENGNGAYLLPMVANDDIVARPKLSVAPRIPLIDLSNAGSDKGKGAAKTSRKILSGVKSVGDPSPRLPFPKAADFRSSSFSGFFGRCPPEEEAGLAKDAGGRYEADIAADSGAEMTSSGGSEVPGMGRLYEN